MTKTALSGASPRREIFFNRKLPAGRGRTWRKGGRASPTMARDARSRNWSVRHPKFREKRLLRPHPSLFTAKHGRVTTRRIRVEYMTPIIPQSDRAQVTDSLASASFRRVAVRKSRPLTEIMWWWWFVPWLLAVARGQSPTQTVTFSMRKLAFSTNQFGIDLYRALNASEGENVALCPFCVGSSLAMLLLGAEGPAAMALRQALYLWGLRPHEIHLAYHDLIGHLGLNLTPLPEEEESGKKRSQEEDTILRILNNLYIQRHFSVHYPYQFMLNRYYNTSVYPLDFVLNAEQSTRYINAYFERHTAGRVQQMLARVPSPSTNLLSLSSLYFRGTLDMHMDVEEGRAFALMQARRARVRFGSHDYLNCTAVEVPFRGGLISLLALLPRDPGGMRLLETRLSAQRLADILNAMHVDTIDFQMPKIAVGQTLGDNLTRALFHLGLVDLFTPGHANLFGISSFGWLHLTNVTHATHVEVRQEAEEKHPSEEEAAPLKVTLDRPFLWFIMDNVAGLAIAMGKMASPEPIV